MLRSLLFAMLLAPSALAQITPLALDEGATGLGLAMRRLPVSGRVLYVTAHPDDENNGVLVALRRGRGLETALLTVTRGDGGQNEIGPELFQAIGILRTEELMALHRYDGARQFFTSAYEFGYSFSVEETFEKWGREEILRDVVRTVRLFRPDVILTLSLEAPGGGQHHQAAAQLARDAFRAAADPGRFADQIQQGLRPWQARKIYQGGTGGGPMEGRQPPPGPSLTMSTADYDPLTGMSHHQLGMLSRTMHKCQGAGQLSANPGDGRGVYFLLDSEPKVGGPETDVLQDVDTSLGGLARFAKDEAASAPFLADGLQAIATAAQQAQAAYDPRALQKALAPLASGLSAVRALALKVQAGGLSTAAKHELADRLRAKEQDFVHALTLAHGLVFRVTVDDGDAVRGQTVNVTARVANQGQEAVRIDDVALRAPEGWTVTRSSGEPQTLAYNQKQEWKYAVKVGDRARYSQPYWRKDPKADRWLYDVPEDQQLPWSPPDLVGTVRFTSAGVSAGLEMPAYNRFEGRFVGGEKQKVLNVVPALSLALTPEIAVIPTGAAKPRREFRVRVRNDAKQAGRASVRLAAPAGWSVEPPEATVELRYEGEEVAARFFVTPPAGLKAGEVELQAVATRDGEEFREGYQTIAYDHIQERHLFHPARSRVKALDVKLQPGAVIGYVRGAGDEVPDAIEQLGFKLEFLSADDLAYGDLARYSTIITGIRAYQTRSDLKASNNRLLDYARAGGNLVIQYNKFEFNQLAETPQAEGFGPRQRDVDSPFAPYPAAVSSNRVSVEETPLKALQPTHAILTTPNAIGTSDWEGWVQERGLYFLNAKDPRYVELLAATDPWPKNPGEKKGMLTTAAVGKGTWTYVGLGLWRQLPAGTTGAYRLLANLLSQPRAK
jgi:LmbE family N-acetylglucosaminyl deacetylase